MLNSPKNILDHQPPFVFSSTNEEWRLIVKIEQVEGKINLMVVEKKNDTFNTRVISLDETPFHVGADVWELNYGATIMTLNHSSLDNHPAKQLWQEWIKQKS